MEKKTCPLCQGHNKECWVCDGNGTIEVLSKSEADQWLAQANEEMKKHAGSPFNDSLKIDFNNLNGDISDGLLSNNT